MAWIRTSWSSKGKTQLPHQVPWDSHSCVTAFSFRGFGGWSVKKLCRPLAALDPGLGILSYTTGLTAGGVSSIGTARLSLQKSWDGSKYPIRVLFHFPPQTSAIMGLICSEIIKDEDFLFLQKRKLLFFHSCRDPQENTKYPETADETEGWSWELSCHHQKHQIRFGQWCKSLYT